MVGHLGKGHGDRLPLVPQGSAQSSPSSPAARHPQRVQHSSCRPLEVVCKATQKKMGTLGGNGLVLLLLLLLLLFAAAAAVAAVAVVVAVVVVVPVVVVAAVAAAAAAVVVVVSDAI